MHSGGDSRGRGVAAVVVNVTVAVTMAVAVTVAVAVAVGFISFGATICTNSEILLSPIWRIVFKLLLWG